MSGTTTVTETTSAPTTLGERIRTARREKGLSQAQLAGSELTKGFISQVESGLVRPSVRSLQLLASRLGKSLDYFLGDESLATAKRLTFHHLAATSAILRSDWRAVRAEVDSGLAVRPEPRERAKLINSLVAAEIADKEYESAFSHISEALAVLDPATDATDVALLYHRRGVAYAELGQLVAATEAFEASRAIVDQYEITDPRLRSRLLVSLGTVYRRLNRTTKAMATYEAALALATRTSEIEAAARSYMGLAASLADSGEFDGAIANYRRALELWERISDVAFELSVLHSLAETHFDQGDLVRARDMAERCLARALSIADAREVAIARTIFAQVALAEGRMDDALRMATEAEQVLAGVSDPRRHAISLRVVGGAHDARGEFAEADAAFARAIELVTSVDHYAERSVIAGDYAQRLRVRGDLDKALDMLELARGAAARR